MITRSRWRAVLPLFVCLFSFQAFAAKPQTPSDHGVVSGLLILADRFDEMASPKNWTEDSGSVESRAYQLGRVVMMKHVLLAMQNQLRQLTRAETKPAFGTDEAIVLSSDVRGAVLSVASRLVALSNGNSLTTPKSFSTGLSQLAADIRSRVQKPGMFDRLTSSLSDSGKKERDFALEETARSLERAILDVRVRFTPGESAENEMQNLAQEIRFFVPETMSAGALKFWNGVDSMLLEMGKGLQDIANAARPELTSKNLSKKYTAELSKTWRLLVNDPTRPQAIGSNEPLPETIAPRPNNLLVALEKLRLINPSARCQYVATKADALEKLKELPGPAPEIEIEIMLSE